jgi:hypothetical protein
VKISPKYFLFENREETGTEPADKAYEPGCIEKIFYGFDILIEKRIIRSFEKLNGLRCWFGLCRPTFSQSLGQKTKSNWV